MYGRNKPVTECGAVSMRFIDGGRRLVYYDRYGPGNAIALNSVGVASTLEAISAGAARPRHSQGVLEWGVHVRIFLYSAYVLMGLPSLNTGLVRVEG